MYRRPKFLEVLLQIRQEMSREADYDTDLFAENVRSGNFTEKGDFYDLSLDKELPKNGQKPKARKVKI
jgi:hypothetical protein